jgi:uncharacterized protein (TIGR00290 family)
MKEKVVVSWSGGKDSAYALYEVLKAKCYLVTKLLTTVTKNDRISVHDVPRVLLEDQAASLGFPLEEMFVPQGVSDAEYEAQLVQLLKDGRATGVSSVVFGDIFLEDVRKFREKLLSKAGLNGVFPLWHRDTLELANNFIAAGFKAVITVVDSQQLSGEFVGREFDKTFLADLSSGVDPCGENGEFHTFVYDGPIFRKRINLVKGDISLKEKRFYHCDLNPVSS